MGRPIRVVGAGAIYHVVARGNDRQMLFLGDDDRARFMELLVEVAGALNWEGFAYCLMGNHFHLAFATPEGDLPEGMRDVMGRYARHFNRVHRRSGHVFGGRYRAGPIESDGHLLSVVRYVARNPVVAGLVADAADWEWGSYREVVHGLPGAGFVDQAGMLELFHRHRWRARASLRHFVEDGLVPGRARVDPRPIEEAGALRRPSVRQVFFVLPPLAATHACHSLGYRHVEIAAASGVTRSAVSYRLRAAPPGSSPGCLARRGECNSPTHMKEACDPAPDVAV